jgi:hypothetical protein
VRGAGYARVAIDPAGYRRGKPEPRRASRRRFALVAPRGALSLGLAVVIVRLRARRAGRAGPDRFAIPATDEGLPGAGPIRRYDWFQNVWRARRTSFAQRLEGDRAPVVFLGDSITRAGAGDWARLPRRQGGEFRGIDGDTSRGVLIR